MADIYREIWIGELVKQFNLAENATWLNGIPDYSEYVDENDTIHLVDVGVDPEVLINNTTYPLQITEIIDKDIPIKLDLFETVATRVRKQTLYAISYKKLKNDIEKHKIALMRSKLNKALHAFAPDEDTPKTPVIKTTGADDGTGRRMCQRKDIITLKKKFDDAGIPEKDRLIVFTTDHVNDLLMEDSKFDSTYLDHTSGKVKPLYSFEAHSYLESPTYSAAGQKRSFGALPKAGDSKASVAFYKRRAFKATGSTDMSASEAKSDAVNKQNLVSFDNRFIALPTKRDAQGAIRSGRI